MHHRATLIVGTLALIFSTAAGLAQAPSSPPKPGPEPKKLGVFVGNWSAVGNVKHSGPQITYTSACEWVSDGFGVLCRETAAGPFGPGVDKITDVELLTYDAIAKNYVLFQVNNVGKSWILHSTAEADIWAWTGQDTMNGQTMQLRFTVK
ncbi:MAG: hypothetical protein ACRD50_00060 [Candidatus Acidiferrales bacterium]